MTLQFLSFNFLTLLYILDILIAFTIIFLERKNPTSTLVWILFLFLLPGIGVLFYLLLSQNFMRKKMFAFQSPEYKRYFSHLSKEIEDIKEGKLIFNNPELANYKDLILLHQNQSKAYFSQNNQVEILTDGIEKFKELFRQIKEAKSHVHILYFIVKRDSLGEQLINILTEKARTGVEVRLIIDALGNKLLEKDFEPLINAGGKVSLFFPSFLSLVNLKINYRNHRKLVIIDGQIGFIGGFNVGNEYLGLKKSIGYWRDTHLLVRGSAVHEMQIRFLLDWKISSAEELTYSLKYFPQPAVTGQTGIQIVSCGPEAPQEEIKQGYLKMINSAKKNIYIQTPYFIPDESIQEALKIAVLSGVDVRIMMPNKPDHPFVYWASYSFIGDLVKIGVKAYLYEKGFLHAKTIVVDDIISSVGTANFDIRSFKLNFEVNAFLYDREIAQKLQQAFEQDMLDCTLLTFEKYRKRSVLIQFKESVSRLFSPLL